MPALRPNNCQRQTMSIKRSPFVLALVLSACSNPDPAAPVGPAVSMPQIQASIDNSTPDAAQRAISNKTWLWTRSAGPAQIHYSSADGKDYAWVVGQPRIFAGEWQVNTVPDASGRMVTQVCLRHPGSYVQGLSPTWSCRPGGTFFYEMAERESGNPLRFAGRTQALFVLERTPANLAEVEGRVASMIGLQE